MAAAGIISGLATGIPIGLSNVFMAMGNARNTWKMIKSNEEIAQKANLTQLKIAAMQIHNLQELEDRRIDFAREQQTELAKMQREGEDLRYERQRTIERLKAEWELMLQTLDHRHQAELEKFRQERNFNNLQWRVETEQAYRAERTQYFAAVQRRISEENRAHNKEMVGYTRLHEKSWALRNPPFIYLDEGPSRLLFFLSPPVITEEESAFHRFPQIETTLARQADLYLSPFYAEKIDVDSGAWLSKAYNGNSALRPLATELSSRSFVVLSADLSPLRSPGTHVNLAIAYKPFGQSTCTFAPVIRDLPIDEDWARFLHLWSFVHCVYIAVYSDLHYFLLGETDTFHFLKVIGRMARAEENQACFLEPAGALNPVTRDLVVNSVAKLTDILRQCYGSTGDIHRTLFRLAEDMDQLDPSLALTVRHVLDMALEYWCLSRYINAGELPDVPANRISENDRAFLLDFLTLNKKLAPQMHINTQIEALLIRVPPAKKIDINKF